ncbi:DUF4214 domain-containing protein [Sulfitobacter sp. S190]|uniref:DUF4214 domain-containing protein n=1 Tax=Sulfitobacter sp. S190 TaxID=2867022 RepID=UPI0021A6A95E|nr:DUF4214 domain-containing protein [Sulfitobacter sp. S190]UWR24447.1 DUF4214 domain-containing protein [Sulfitobacter sp. S190]
MLISHATTQVSAQINDLIGLDDILALPDYDLIYTVARQGGGVQVWDAETFALQDSHYFAPSEGLDANWGLLPTVFDGNTTLVASGGHGLNAVRLAPDGNVAGNLSLDMSGGGRDDSLTAVAELTSGGQTYLVGAGRDAEGVQVWAKSADGALRSIEQGLTQTAAPGGTAALSDAGDGTLLALSVTGNHLTRMQMNDDGQLSVMMQLDVRDGLWVQTPTHLEVADVAGQSYAIVGAQGSSSVSVVALDPDGQMRVTDHVVDDRDTRFSQLSVLETVEISGQTFVVAGGADDGLTVMTVLPGGRLLHLETIVDDTAMALEDPTALALLVEEAGFAIAVAGRVPDAEDGSSGLGFSRLEVDLGTSVNTLQADSSGQRITATEGWDQISGGAGNDRLEGQGGRDILMDGRGRDTLEGGEGRDIFVLEADGQTDVVSDFEIGVDQIDLSQMGRFYTIDALDIRAQSWGAEIRYGGETLQVRSADGQSLSADDFSITDLGGLWHLPVDPVVLGNQQIIGSAASDFIEGGTGSDTLMGGAGADVLVGQDGDDWLGGGAPDVEFDPVAAQVFRLYQATLDREPDAAGIHGWTDHLIEGTRTLTEVARGFVQSAEFETVYGDLDTADFVTLLYQNVLDRAPDAGGLAHWTARLDSGAMTPEQVVVGFSESAEFTAATAVGAVDVSRTGLQVSWSEDVFLLYQATLDRVPDLAGFMHWTQELAEGRAFDTIVAGFTGSAEFRQTYDVSDNGDFVSLLYENVLDRAADSAGLAGWMSRLDSGAMTREDVVTGFSGSAEFKAAMAEPMSDWMRAQGTDDQLDGGGGTNVLQGGLLSDRFVFRADSPADHTVVDPESWDTFVFEGFGYSDVSDLKAHVTAQDGDLLFFDQGVSVTLRGLSLEDLDAGMLEF